MGSARRPAAGCGPHQLTPGGRGPGRPRSCAVPPPRPDDRRRGPRSGRDRPRRWDADVPVVHRSPAALGARPGPHRARPRHNRRGAAAAAGLWGSRMQHMPLASGYRRSPVVRQDRRHVAAALSVAVVVILGHPPEVDLVDNVADTRESVLGNWSRAGELVLVEGPSSWEVVVDHLADLRA